MIRTKFNGKSSGETDAEPVTDLAVMPARPWVSKGLSDNQRAFLVAYGETGNITEACKIAGISNGATHLWRKFDATFIAAFAIAKEAAADRLEQEAWRRAVNGTDKPVFYKGTKCGNIRDYSDTLLIFLLKGIRPDKYRETWQGGVGYAGPVEVNVIFRDTSGGN